jgi:hypothetical protein
MSSTHQTTRDQAAEILRTGHAQLDGLLERLPTNERSRRGAIGGGDWSADDLVGHIAAWERLALHAARDRRAGRIPDAQRVFDQEGVDEFNARKVKEWRELTPSEIKAQARATSLALIEILASLSDEEWGQEAWYPTDARSSSLGELLGSITGGRQGPFEHIADHVDDLAAHVLSVAGG